MTWYLQAFVWVSPGQRACRELDLITRSYSFHPSHPTKTGNNRSPCAARGNHQTQHLWCDVIKENPFTVAYNTTEYSYLCLGGQRYHHYHSIDKIA